MQISQLRIQPDYLDIFIGLYPFHIVFMLPLSPRICQTNLLHIRQFTAAFGTPKGPPYIISKNPPCLPVSDCSDAQNPQTPDQPASPNAPPSPPHPATE